MDCVICHSNISECGLLGSLQCSDLHIFHLACIKRWSQVNASCPCCRQAFSVIQVRTTCNGPVIGKRYVVDDTTSIRLENMGNYRPSEHRELDTLACQICKATDDQDCMVFCDDCDDAYHLGCHRPPIAEIPPVHVPWFCPICADVRSCAGVSGSSVGRVGRIHSDSTDSVARLRRIYRRRKVDISHLYHSSTYSRDEPQTSVRPLRMIAENDKSHDNLWSYFEQARKLE